MNFLGREKKTFDIFLMQTKYKYLFFKKKTVIENKTDVFEAVLFPFLS